MKTARNVIEAAYEKHGILVARGSEFFWFEFIYPITVKAWWAEVFLFL